MHEECSLGGSIAHILAMCCKFSEESLLRVMGVTLHVGTLDPATGLWLLCM